MLTLLERRGVEAAPLLDLVELNPYAVLLRYEYSDSDDDPLDRPAIVDRIDSLIRAVEALAKRGD